MLFGIQGKMSYKIGIHEKSFFGTSELTQNKLD